MAMKMTVASVQHAGLSKQDMKGSERPLVYHVQRLHYAVVSEVETVADLGKRGREEESGCHGRRSGPGFLPFVTSLSAPCLTIYTPLCACVK